MANSRISANAKHTILALLGAGALAAGSGCSTPQLQYALGTSMGMAAGSPNAPYSMKQRQGLAYAGKLTRNDAQWKHDEDIARKNSQQVVVRNPDEVYVERVTEYKGTVLHHLSNGWTLFYEKNVLVAKRSPDGKYYKP